MKRVRQRQVAARLSVGVLSVILSGCSWWPFGPRETTKPRDIGAPISSNSFATGSARPGSADPVVHLAFEVLRTTMPLSQGRDSLKVWNHVDTMRVQPDVAARLARNGIRVGAGSSASWGAIRVILEAANAKSSKDQFPTQNGVPLLIELGAVSEGESIFHYGGDNRLTGRTFPAGSKLLQIDYAYHPRLGGATEVQLSFEIRHDQGETRWERQSEGVVLRVPAVDRYVFEDLQAATTLKTGEFLVVGTSEQADNEYLVGSRFLSETAAGERTETLLFLTPMAYQTQTARVGN